MTELQSAWIDYKKSCYPAGFTNAAHEAHVQQAF